MPGDPKELRPTQLVERTRVLYHALVTADPLADDPLADDHHQITAAFVGHYVTALGPAIGRYREPADQDRFAPQEEARFYERELTVLAGATYAPADAGNGGAKG